VSMVSRYAFRRDADDPLGRYLDGREGC
jgi:hypothetical protein